MANDALVADFDAVALGPLIKSDTDGGAIVRVPFRFRSGETEAAGTCVMSAEKALSLAQELQRLVQGEGR